MQTIGRFCLAVAASGCVLAVIGLIAGLTEMWQAAAVGVVVSLAIGVGTIPALRSYQFTAWIVAAVVAALVFPALFAPLSPDRADRPQNKWIMLFVIQAVMFGMGTQMRLSDFAGLGRASRGVIVGLVLQFSIMPLVGYGIGRLGQFPPEIAAGMVLIGSCSSGLASNVMTYLAGANLALSVTVTALGTLIAPLMTPLWMKLLAGTLVPVDFVKMMLEIVKIVIVPIGAALLHDFLTRASLRVRMVVFALAILSTAWLAIGISGGWNSFATQTGQVKTAFEMSGFFAGAILAGTLYHALTRCFPQSARLMPRLSMLGIIFFTAVTTAAGREELLSIGWLLLLAVIVHNTVGYSLGYWLSRGCGLDVNSARTISLEVGIHNGGMATGIASAMGQLGTLGLPAVIFSPWMNVSGSLLANYWRKRPASSSSDSKVREPPGNI